MNVNVERLNSMNDLIRRKATGSPTKFGKKLNVSKSTVQRDIRFMRKVGAPIKFDYSKQSYYYENTGSVKLIFIPEHLSGLLVS